MKRIEELTKDDILEAEDADLYKYRLSFCQVFEKRQREDQPIDMMLPGYIFLTNEMKKRRMIWGAHEIDMKLFSAQMGATMSEEEEVEEVVDVPATESVDVSIISKSDDDDERIVVGVVYEPDEEDTQGDYATAEEIRTAAYSFMENGQTYHVMHKGVAVNIGVLESYLAPVEFAVGEEIVKKGTWMLTSRIIDADMWADIKSGKLAGYSMGGTHEV